MIKGKCAPLISYIFVIAILILMREYWLLHRTALHVDESMSFIISAYNQYGFDKPFPGIVTMTGDELRHAMWFNDPTFSGMLHDLKQLWVFNRDTPHSNLYYSLLRIWFTGVESTGMAFTLGWAGQLNIALSACSMLMLGCLAFRMFGSHVIAIFAIFIGFIGAGTISNTIFARPYQLQETMFVAFMIMSFIFISDQRKSLKFMIGYGVVAAFTLLTGYFAIIYVGIIMLLILIMALALCERDYISLTKRAAVFIVTTCVAGYLIYPPYLFVSGGRQSEAISKTGELAQNVALSIKSFELLQWYYPFIFMVALVSVVLAVILFVIRKERRFTSAWYVVMALSVAIWYAIVMFFAPYKIPRYVYPVLPIVCMVYCFIAYAINIKSKYLAYAFMAVTAWMTADTFVNTGKVEYQPAPIAAQCKYSANGEAAFIIEAAYRLNALTDCLSNEKHIIASNRSEIPKIEDDQSVKYLISDFDIEGMDKVDSSGYFRVYKIR
ncbi:hypothetical protein QQF21_17900 [Lelliottia sp. V89_10]|uniref:hypothetical protein n=1 Tax=Lelliottia wanjuensis TaxID=3050585 RepID=UPI00249F4E6B|nr:MULTISPECIES: hypothetical protein [unclassified Lelliottia]MDI3361133.1 hypothetical protein [Lelliottia sp. V89_13]MDK9551232.1 hypothetical protein [Lelliottia sp. V89_5]MDK9597496.1 hypothetical protein [Lelliottia sp. V89_10]